MPKRKVDSSLERVTYYIPKDYLDKVDADASQMGFSRSNMLTLIVHTYYENKKSISMMADAKYIMEHGVVIGENPDLYSASPEMKNAFEQVVKKYGGKTD